MCIYFIGAHVYTCVQVDTERAPYIHTYIYIYIDIHMYLYIYMRNGQYSRIRDEEKECREIEKSREEPQKR